MFYAGESIIDRTPEIPARTKVSQVTVNAPSAELAEHREGLEEPVAQASKLARDEEKSGQDQQSAHDLLDCTEMAAETLEKGQKRPDRDPGEEERHPEANGVDRK